MNVQTYAKQQNKEGHPIIDAPATTGHNDVVLQQEQRLRNWQITTWLALGLASVLVVTNSVQWMGRKDHYIPVVLGPIEPTRYLAEMTPENAHAMPVKIMIIEQFIRGIRTVTPDQTIQMDGINRAGFLSREKVRIYLADQLKQPENDIAALLKRGVAKTPADIQISPQTENSFIVLWTETVTDMNESKKTQWRADITLETKDPATLTSTERKNSPFGIFVSFVSFSNVSKVAS